MIKLEHIHENLKIAIPIFLSGSTVMVSGMISANIVSYSNGHNWFLLGQYLPINYIVFALLEAGRVCSMRLASISSYEINRFKSCLVLAFLLFSLFIVLSIICFIVLFVREWLSNGSHIQYDYYSFVIHYFWAYSIIAFAALLNAALFGLRKGLVASTVVVITSLFSVLLTYYFYHNNKLGINSIPLSAAIAYSVGGVISFLVMVRNKNKMNDGEVVRYDHLWQTIKSTGAPVFLVYCMIPVSLYYFNYVIAQFGSSASSAFSIAYRLQNIVILPAIAIGIAAGILMNRENNYHEKNHIEYSALLLCTLIYSIVAILIFANRSHVSSWFTNDRTIKNILVSYLMYTPLSYVLYCPYLSLSAIWEQTGLALRSFYAIAAMFAFQIIIGIVALLSHQLNTFFALTAVVMFFIPAFIIHSHYRNPFKRIGIASAGGSR